MERPDLALQAFRAAYRINPNLDGIADSIQALEQILHDD
jgi:hypothetical protein